MKRRMSAISPRTRYWILGTAGHIDHGKSTLVRALTGVDPDRLPEEKSRGMTIELGFAPLRIGDRNFGIVDVPGHEKFVRTMVAGATGMDLAMLVVAADDGVMPQTREHTQILDLLGIESGCIVITKIDAVPAERVEAVRGQIAELIAGTSLESFPVTSVSSTSGTGLDDLKRVLQQCADGVGERAASSIFRMAIDRAFLIRGRGTVVTGSVLSGRVETGETLELLPQGIPVKVREVQSHGQSDGGVGVGQRAALNLTGARHEQVRRGNELATPGFARPSHCFDASIRVLTETAKPIRSHGTVRVCLGTTETLARVVVFEGENAAPGKTAFVQLRTREPIIARHGQRFILRHETATHTLGGGRVLRPVSQRNAARWAGNRSGLEALQSDDERARVSEVLRRMGFDDDSDLHLSCRAGVDPARIGALQRELLDGGGLIALPGAKRPVHRGALDDLRERTTRFLKRWHDHHRNEPGYPEDKFVSRLSRRIERGDRSKRRTELARSLFEFLTQSGTIRVQGRFVCDAEFAPALSDEDRTMLDGLLRRFEQAAFQPPKLTELRTEYGRSFARADRMIQHALSQGQLVRIDAELLLSDRAYRDLAKTVSDLVRREGPVTVGQVREALASTRKFVVPYLEHLDRQGVTRRDGDRRVLA